MTFGEKVTAVGIIILSQQAFAREIGVAFSTVNRWERGHVKPNYKAQAAFAQIM